MKSENTSLRLKKIMSERHLKQVDILEKCKPFCEKYGISMNKSDISQYVSGKTEPGSKKLTVLGLALGVTETWLMGYDVPMEREDSINTNLLFSIENFISIPKTKKVPLLGTIACGKPILANENVENYIDMDADIHAHFALRCKGDSMINARILDGDIVYIHKQDRVENGEIAAVLIDGCETSEATLKRVYINKDKIRLCAENPSYKDLVFFENEMNKVRIIGKAVAFLSDVK